MPFFVIMPLMLTCKQILGFLQFKILNFKKAVNIDIIDSYRDVFLVRPRLFLEKGFAMFVYIYICVF